MQFLNLENSYVGEITYIKDCTNKLLFISDEFAKVFQVDKDNIIGQDISMIGMPSNVAKSILEQESILYKSNKAQDLIYVHKHENETVSYLIRKRILRNPTTKKVIGLFGNMEPFTPGYFRKVYLP